MSCFGRGRELAADLPIAEAADANAVGNELPVDLGDLYAESGQPLQQYRKKHRSSNIGKSIGCSVEASRTDPVPNFRVTGPPAITTDADFLDICRPVLGCDRNLKFYVLQYFQNSDKIRCYMMLPPYFLVSKCDELLRQLFMLGDAL